MDYLEYKGYKGSVEYSKADNCLFGKVLGMSKDLILYEGNTIDELRADFEAGIDNYIAGCVADGIEPRKPYSGTLNIRISPEIHSKIAMLAQEAAVLLGEIARTLIRRVALHDGAVHRVYNALPEFGVQKVLVALLAGVHLDRDLARKLLAESAVKLQHLFRRDLAGEIYDRLHPCVLLVNACFSASRWTP